MLDFSDDTTREQSIGLMKEIEGPLRPVFRSSLDRLLTEPEKKSQSFVDDLGFREGAWYRPIHNFIVPAVAVALSEKEEFSRDLVYAAQIHDAGNSQMVVDDTGKGASWEDTDKRFEHMRIGVGMFRNFMRDLRLEYGDLVPNEKRSEKLAIVIGFHDAPYIGNEMSADKIGELCDKYGIHTDEKPVLSGGRIIDEDLIGLRSADRVFVPSGLSWYKDMMAYISDDQYQKKAKLQGFSIDPLQFLLCRLPFFYDDETQLPEGWDSEKYPLTIERTSFNEGGRTEKPYTRTEKTIVGRMFFDRADELNELENFNKTFQFGDLFERVLKAEVNYIMNYSKGD